MGITICLKSVPTCCSTTPLTGFLRLADGGALAGVALNLPGLLFPLSLLFRLYGGLLLLFAGGLSYNCYCTFPWPLSYLTQLPK